MADDDGWDVFGFELFDSENETFTETDDGSAAPGDDDSNSLLGGGGAPGEETASFSDIAPNFLRGETGDVLATFARSPIAFVLGIVLQALVGGLQGLTNVFLEAITVVFFGSSPGLTGQLGLADMPLYFGSLVAGFIRPTPGGRSSLGDAVIAMFNIPISALLDIASEAGPAEPIVIALGAGGLVITLAFVLRKLVDAVLSSVPFLEGLLS